MKFPIGGLDLSGYVQHKDTAESHVYELYAVSNHYGSSFNGHYTAHAKVSVIPKIHWCDLLPKLWKVVICGNSSCLLREMAPFIFDQWVRWGLLFCNLRSYGRLYYWSAINQCLPLSVVPLYIVAWKLKMDNRRTTLSWLVAQVHTFGTVQWGGFYDIGTPSHHMYGWITTSIKFVGWGKGSTD